MKNTFVFTDEKIHITSNNESYSGSAEVDYGVIIKAYETVEYFYLFINSKASYAIDKKGFESGTALDLRNLLLSKIPAKKYKYARGLKEK